jgi:hypothetical protein
MVSVLIEGAYGVECPTEESATAVITGWLGRELVGRLGVGVDEGANLNTLCSFGPSRTLIRHKPALAASATTTVVWRHGEYNGSQYRY